MGGLGGKHATGDPSCSTSIKRRSGEHPKPSEDNVNNQASIDIDSNRITHMITTVSDTTAWSMDPGQIIALNEAYIVGTGKKICIVQTAK